MNFKGFLFLISSLFYITATNAQWTGLTNINTSVAVAVKSQQNTHCITDSKNGIIIAWDDNRNNTTNSTDIFEQILNFAVFG